MGSIPVQFSAGTIQAERKPNVTAAAQRNGDSYGYPTSEIVLPDGREQLFFVVTDGPDQTGSDCYSIYV